MALYKYIQIPNGYKRIGRGIVMCWSGNDISLAVDLEVHDATPELAAEIGHTIETIWNDAFNDGYSVDTKVSMSCSTGMREDPNRTQIYVSHDVSPSSVVWEPILYYAYMKYHVNRPSQNFWVPAHEFGHLLGLDDRYHESVQSRINGMYGRPRSMTVEPGWEGNIMAVDRGTLQKRNLQELFALHAYQMINFMEEVVHMRRNPRTGEVNVGR